MSTDQAPPPDPCPMGVEGQHCSHYDDGRRPCCLCGASPR